MAACNLKVVLDDPNSPRMGGDVVTGKVIVQCTKECNCKGLQVTTNWATHGQGNVDRAVADEATVFQGAWQAGQEYSYPFQLKAASWPPTYYGTYLNISHTVAARAKLAWTKDPKAEAEFPVVATASPADMLPTRRQTTRLVKTIVVGIVGLIFLIFLLLFLWFIAIIGVVVAIAWFIKVLLPKLKTGNVRSSVEPQRLRPNDQLKGHLELAPKLGLRVNGVSYTVSCTEQCSSGSGSTRQHHNHTVLKQQVSLADAQVLAAGQRHSYDFDFQIPPTAPPSIKLTDNAIVWAVEMRVDIPKWPDWTQVTNVIVEPTGEVPQPSKHFADGALRSEEDKWLEQVLNQLRDCDDDAEQKRTVLEAISQLEFSLTIEGIEEDTDPPESDHLPQDSGQWVSAIETRRDLYIDLFIPQNLALPKTSEQLTIRVGILDLDAETDCLVARLIGVI